MNKKTTSDGLMAGLLGAIVFAVFFFLIDVGSIFSITLGVAAFVGGLFLFERKKSDVIDKENDLKTALESGAKNLAEIRDIEKKIRKPSMLATIREIDTILEKILIDIKKDPSKLRNARQFLDYYVGSTIKILSKYVEISSQNVTDSGIQASLARVEGMLGTIGDAFNAQHARILSNDVMDLDTEIQTLDQTIKMEGLGKD